MAPSLTLGEVAAAAGVPIRPELAGLTPRGVCDAAAASAASNRSEDIAAAVFGHRVCPPWAQRSATVPNLASGTSAWRCRGVRDVAADGRLLRRCAAAGASDHLRHLAAANPTCPPAVLEALAHDSDYRIQGSLAANPACPPGVVMGVLGLATRGDESLMSDLACSNAVANPNCPDAALRHAATATNNAYLRVGAARNPNSDPAVVSVLAGDSNDFVREAVAYNSNCGPEVLVRLASDSAADVAVAALTNPSCPEQTLRQACGENLDGEHRGGVASNPACPPDLIERLVEDPERVVAYWVVANPACPPELVERAATDPSSVVRSGVAQRRDCPADLLARLARDEEWAVRRNVAQNPDTAHRVVVSLSEDPTPAVREIVAARFSEMILST